MSEKKTTGKQEHTLTLEDQAKLAQANAKKMEQGKIEVMKVVEGVQGAEKLAELIEKGKKNGKLSASELMDVLENMALESDQMDKIYDTLENLGIDTVGDDYLTELADDVGPQLEDLGDIEEIPEEEIVDPNTLVDSFGIDDPVRMYLKEIGKVNLLTPDEEIQLAQDMGAGDAAKEQLAELEKARKAGEESPISEEDEKELRRLLKRGEAAKQRLAEANLRLVVSIAKRYVGRGMLFLDLIQEGNLGHLVDPPGHHPGHCRPGPHHPHPRPYGGDHQQGHPGVPPAPPGAGARPLPRGDRRGDGHARGQGAGDPEDRPGARLPGNPHRRGGGLPSGGLHPRRGRLRAL